MKKTSKIPAAITGTLIMALMTFGAILWSNRGTGIPDTLNCMFDIKAFDNSTTGLVTGYNYSLLKDYTDSRGIGLNTIICKGEESTLDSLIAKRVDIVIRPFEDSLIDEVPVISCYVDTLTRWVSIKNNKRLIEDMQAWVDEQTSSESHPEIKEKFFTRLDPFKRRPGQSFISPYDDMLKASADSIGWDWRMLAAVAWQESHFRMDVESHRGAKGVMQITPDAASSLGIENVVDPASGIDAGAKYLSRLYKLYESIPDEQERIKFTLASYNAGEGRIRDCREYAKSKELEGNTWDEIVSLIPEIEDFKGKETIAYVDSVLAVHREFCRICR